MAIQKTATGDLTTAIAKQIYQTAVVGDAYRQEAKDIIGKEVDDPMLRRGEFFGHAAAARATSWLPKRFQHQMPDLRGSEYLMRGQQRSLMSPFASPINPVPSSAIVPSRGSALAAPGPRLSDGQLARLDPVAKARMIQERMGIPVISAETGFIPNKKSDLFGMRSLGKGIKVREEKLGKFLAAVAASLTKSLASINKKIDESEEGIIVAKDGISATHKQLEDNSDTLEAKLDKIIEVLRAQTAAQRREEDQIESYMKEATVEQEADRSDASKIRMADEDEQEFALKMEEDDRERQADTQDNEQQLNLPIAAGDDGEGFARGGVVSGPDSGYLALLHGDEMITPLDNNFTQGQTLATNPIMSAETGFKPNGDNPKSMSPKFTPSPTVNNTTSTTNNVSGGMEMLAQAIELPAKAAGIVTMGVLGKVLASSIIPSSAVTAIQSITAPIAAAFGIPDVVSGNIAREAAVGKEGSGGGEDGMTTGSENKKKGWMQNIWNWITGSGGGTNITRNYRGTGGAFGGGNLGESGYGGGIISSISNSSYGGDNNIAFGNPVNKLKFDPANPDRENPHPQGSLLYNIWQRRLREYQIMKEAGMISSISGDNWVFNKSVSQQFANVSGPPSQSGAVSNLIHNESMEGEIRDLVASAAENPDVVLNNQNLSSTQDQQVEYSPIQAKGIPFPVGFNISPYA